MNKSKWKDNIIEACKGIGTYRPEFDSVIDTLATILEQRDKAMEMYEATGSKPVVTHTNKAHEKNYVKNPMLAQWSDLNKDALAYWRDLGLTPNGLKRINENEMKGHGKKDGIEEALKSLKI